MACADYAVVLWSSWLAGFRYCPEHAQVLLGLLVLLVLSSRCLAVCPNIVSQNVPAGSQLIHVLLWHKSSAAHAWMHMGNTCFSC